MRILATFILLTVLLASGRAQQIETPSDHTPGTPLNFGTKLTLHSKIMDEERPIIVALPDGYEENESNYPVLYLTDGLQNIWHVIGSVEVLTRTGSIPPVIIVGIQSTNRDRDFSPTVAKKWPRSGGGPKFLDFIEKELILYIDTNYRTNAYRILEGHSLGGLFTAYTLLNRPDLFDAHIIMSPSFWWNNEEITEKATAFFKSNPTLDKSIFFGIGTLESDTTWGMRKELSNFIEVIKRNKPDKLRFKHMEMEDEGHMSSPLLSNYYGLKFIFADMKLPESLIKNYSDERFLAHENMIMSKYGKEAKQSAESYVQIASYLVQKNNLQGAITVLNRSIQAYPFDISLVQYLASIYEKNNDKARAIATYEQAITVSKKYKYGREAVLRDKIKALKGS